MSLAYSRDQLFIENERLKEELIILREENAALKLANEKLHEENKRLKSELIVIKEQLDWLKSNFLERREKKT